jgi:hypothetical protein
VTIDDTFGGWQKAQKAHFADGGTFRPDLPEKIGGNMPLTDLIRYFNAADSSGDSTLYLQGARCRLASRAAPWARCFSRLSICARSASSGIRRP